MEFGDILKQIRRERGLSQDELAALLGTTKQVLSRYETKKRVPRLSVVADYAQKLGIPLSMLSGEQADPAPEITRENGVRRVPILGAAACGEPIYAEPVICCQTESGEPPFDFALRCKGDSMIDARIYDGDVVFIRKQDYVDDGTIAAVMVDDDATLKRVYRLADGRIELRAANARYAPIIIGGEGETRNVRILGKAVAFQGRII